MLIVVCIDGLGPKTSDSVEVLGCGSTQARESAECRPLGFGNLRIFDCIN